MSETLQFFAYDECMSVAAMAAAAGTNPIGEGEPAALDLFALRFTTISRDSPRLGLPNLLPVSDATVTAEDTCRTVFGVLFTLPATSREALLQHMADKGSYNVFTTALDVRPLKTASAERPAVKAMVVAALDLHWLSVVKAVADDFATDWQPLPLPRCGSVDGDVVGEAAARGKSGARRWPGYHWCNCIASARLAPTAETLARIQRGVRTSDVAHTTHAQALEAYEAMLAAVPTRSVQTEAQEERTWYLAYGSNMSWEQLCVRVGPPYQRRAVKLPEYVLIANKVPADATATFGYYNIEPHSVRQRKAQEGLTKRADHMPDYVCGAAYEISAAQLALMDGYEWGYTRQWLRCEDISGVLGLTGADTGAAWACGVDAPDSARVIAGAWAYIATETSEALMPSAEYLSRVLEGEDAVPSEYSEAIRTTPTNVLRSPRQEKRLRKEL